MKKKKNIFIIIDVDAVAFVEINLYKIKIL